LDYAGSNKDTMLDVKLVLISSLFDIQDTYSTQSV
jgi:hypothetical protein